MTVDAVEIDSVWLIAEVKKEKAKEEKTIEEIRRLSQNRFRCLQEFDSSSEEE